MFKYNFMNVLGTHAPFPLAFFLWSHAHLSVFIGLKDRACFKVASFALNSQGVFVSVMLKRQYSSDIFSRLNRG